MKTKKIDTPVLLVIFNRPDTTKRVFSEIRRVKPSRLFVAADGPRVNRIGEKEKCETARKITERVDWPCKVERLYRKENLGCMEAVGGAITWFFKKVKEGIILEDDCVPSDSFFTFCQEMLKKYRNDERIMMVSGTNLVGKWKDDVQDYHFSYYGSVWGWATWRRSWKYYDPEMKLWQKPKSKDHIKNILIDRYQYRVRLRQLEETYENRVNSWAYRWSFSKLMRAGLSIVPSVNLVTNIGFGSDATHTQSIENDKRRIKNYEIPFPVRENKLVVVDRRFDEKYFIVSNNATLIGKILNSLF